jgi:dihydrofolate synthase / folylpolyglutamate synthase
MQYHYAMKFNNYEEVLELLNKKASQQIEMKMSGEDWIKRAKLFMEELGNPQNDLKVVHIAGTSGKGSTTYLTAHLLNQLGYKVGSTLSPHIVDVRERIQIDNQLISKELFTENFNEIWAVVEKMESCSYGPPSYFEIIIALAYYTFKKAKVDYAVVETGLGGTLDATNTVTREDKIAVITKLGLDHVKHLGKTIKQIAVNKAGIIQQKNLVITLFQHFASREVIERRVNEQEARLVYLKKGLGFFDVKAEEDSTYFSFKYEDVYFKNLKLGLLGSHQAENASLALCAVISLGKRDGFGIEESVIRNGLESAHFIGRMDLVRVDGQKVIIDGAHNRQKMGALLKSLKEIYPGEKFNFLVSFKLGKDFKVMMKQIMLEAREVTITSFGTQVQDFVHSSVEVKEIEKVCQELGFRDYEIVPVLEEAFEKALSHTNGVLVVTGSLYFVGDIYKLMG